MGELPGPPVIMYEIFSSLVSKMKSINEQKELLYFTNFRKIKRYENINDLIP